MDLLVVALVSGLLGGGVSGALIAGFVTLRQQRRAFEHERQSRFLDLKRQRYADLLRLADEWVRALSHQRTVAAGVARGEGGPEDIPTLGPTTAIEQLADEIDLLAPEPVAGCATRLAVAVVALGMYAYNADAPHGVQELVPVNEVLAGYTAERNRFVAAAKGDLGVS